MVPNPEKMIRSWLKVQLGKNYDTLTDKTDLLNTGLLDSFALLTLSSLVEEILGHALSDEERSDPNLFQSLESIMTNFFTEPRNQG